MRPDWKARIADRKAKRREERRWRAFVARHGVAVETVEAVERG